MKKHNLQAFLIRNYVKLIMMAAAIIFLLTLVQNELLVRSAIHSDSDRISNIIRLHRNDLLNEIALKDQNALQIHIGNMVKEIGVDFIELKAGSMVLIETAPSRHTPLLENIVALLSRVYRIPELTYSLANDFGHFNYQLRVSFAKSLLARDLAPLLVNSLALTLIFTFLAFIVGRFNFRVINRDVIIPLTNISKLLQSQDQKLIDELNRRRYPLIEIDALIQGLKEHEQFRKMKVASEVYTQVAHDIRSPLAALEMLSKNVDDLSEERRLLVKSAVARIRDIANSLLNENRKIQTGDRAEQEPLTTELLPALIETLVTEKRIQYRSRLGIEIETVFSENSYGLFVQVQPVEFKRVLSNLINNSVESIQSAHGFVRILVEEDKGSIKICITDTGKGMPQELLSKIGTKGFTIGKQNGSGLGIYHAKKSVESWRGRLEIASVEGHGSTVSIKMPKQQAPSWFVPALNIGKEATVVIVDDDDSIHHIWTERLGYLAENLKPLNVHSFSTGAAAQSWILTEGRRALNLVCLVDYEFIGQDETGLDLIDKCGIANDSVLITSRYEEKDILSRCEAMGVRLIPKGMAGFVPLA